MTDRFYKIIIIVLILWLALLSAQQVLFGMAGLGVLLIFCGIWVMATAKTTWENYLKAYKKLPKKKQSIWTRPSITYYYLNLVVIVPLLIVLGVSLIVSAYLIII